MAGNKVRLFVMTAATGTGCGRRFLLKTAVTLWTRTDQGSSEKSERRKEKKAESLVRCVFSDN